MQKNKSNTFDYHEWLFHDFFSTKIYFEKRISKNVFCNLILCVDWLSINVINLHYEWFVDFSHDEKNKLITKWKSKQFSKMQHIEWFLSLPWNSHMKIDHDALTLRKKRKFNVFCFLNVFCEKKKFFLKKFIRLISN